MPPRTLRSISYEESLDTPANRFARFILEDWRSAAVDTRISLLNASRQSRNQVDRESPSHWIERGIVETDKVELLLQQRLFGQPYAAAGRMAVAESPHQVVQNRAGYRELYSQWLRTSMRWS